MAVGSSGEPFGASVTCRPYHEEMAATVERDEGERDEGERDEAERTRRRERGGDERERRGE